MTLIATNIYLPLLIGWLAGALANRAADYLPYGPIQRFFGRVSWQTLPHYCTLWWYPWRREQGQWGICPHCGERRPWRAPLVEVTMILLFLFVWRIFHNNPLLLGIGWLYAFFFLIVTVIDYEQRRVLNQVLAPMAVLVLLLSFTPVTPTPVETLLGGAAGFGLFLVLAIVQRGAMGAGDVKLAAVIGLMAGYPDVITALCIGAIFAGLAALILLASRRYTRKSTMAYAPYLALGALLTLLVQLGGG